MLLAIAIGACGELAPDAQRQSTEDGLGPPGRAPEDVSERQRLASSGDLVRPPSSAAPFMTPLEMAEALDIPPGMIANVQLTAPDPQAAMRMTNLGVIEPRRGDSFVVMSTGLIAVDPPPEPGTDYSPGGVDGDAVTLEVDLDVPVGATQLSFDFNFLSAESPDWVGSIFNDTFVATVTDALGTRVIARASVNSSFFFDVSESRAGGSGYDLFVDDPAGVDFAFGAAAYPPTVPLFPDAGITDYQSVNVGVASGPVSIKFDIRDLGDGILDSTVILDNIVFSAMEVVDPNPDLVDTTRRRVTTDPALLAAGGKNVEAVAADGATPLLLRVNVPGPGQVEFSMVGASAPQSGALRAVGAGAGGASSALVDAVEVSPGAHYAFALYTSPADFNRGGDEAAAEWALRLAAEYVPDTGPGFRHEHELRIVRPPVIFVHDVWSDCQAWSESQLHHDSRFVVTCADYGGSNATQDGPSDFQTNGRVVMDALFEALNQARDQAIAVTQADVIGHGMGGLLARKHVDTTSYRRPTNFDEGDINRLITINTPHLGTRMADAIVAFREGLKDDPSDPTDSDQWTNVRNGFLDAGLNLDDGGAIDELQTTSAILQDLPETVVPSHALASSGGYAIAPSTARGMLGNIGGVYMLMAYLDPSTRILGPTSDVFCSDHDLFVSAWSQKGGLAGDATTELQVTAANPQSSHFDVIRNVAHSAALVDLLNSSISGPRFAPSLPRPSAAPADPDCAGSGSFTASSVGSIQNITQGSLSILSPKPGTLVSPNAALTVVVEGAGGFQPGVVLVSGAGGVAILQPPVLEADFTVPADAIGNIEFNAFGADGAGQILLSAPVTLPVDAKANLVTMQILNGDTSFVGSGSTRRLTVFGHYDDGVMRDISDPALGTVYSTSNTSIAMISSDGVITAVSPGIATIVARNGSSQVSISVTVGDSSFCLGPLWTACTPECPCGDGYGDCDEDEDCIPGGRCLDDVGLDYGYGDPEVDVCVVGCPEVGAGSWAFCTAGCPCDDGEGDCDSDAECVPGARCLDDVGTSYGYGDPEIDVCVVGCPPVGVGGWHFCTASCQCSQGQGDCDSDAECTPGLVCARNVGAGYGWGPDVDVCEAAASML